MSNQIEASLSRLSPGGFSEFLAEAPEVGVREVLEVGGVEMVEGLQDQVTVHFSRRISTNDVLPP